MAGFTMVFDAIVVHYKEAPTVYGRSVSPITVALVFGAVYRFCSIDKENPHCDASAETIGDRCDTHESVVRRCLKVLVNDGWLEHKPNPGRPSVYRMTSRSMAMIMGQKYKQGKAVIYDDRP